MRENSLVTSQLKLLLKLLYNLQIIQNMATIHNKNEHMQKSSARVLLELILSLTKQLKNSSHLIAKNDFYSKTEVVHGFQNRHDSEIIYSAGLNSDLVSTIDDDLHCWGMSYSLVSKTNSWEFSGEIGYSSYYLGFDERKGIVFDESDFGVFLKKAKSSFSKLLAEYLLEAEKYS